MAKRKVVSHSLHKLLPSTGNVAFSIPRKTNSILEIPDTPGFLDLDRHTHGVKLVLDVARANFFAKPINLAFVYVI